MNSGELLDSISQSDRSETHQVSLLGLNWDTQRDTLTIKFSPVQESSSKVTRRLMLKFVASFFDPLGLLSPVFLRAKSFLQLKSELMKDWDDPLPKELVPEWNALTTEISTANSLEIPRNSSTSEGRTFELICFTDASALAYCATVYLKSLGQNSTRTTLVFAKVRLAPVRIVTIPRLELVGILIGVRTLDYVE